MSQLSISKTLIFILVAFVFSITVRLIWVYQFSDAEQFKFNNEFMINTNDGYYFAEGARDILSGDTNINSSSPTKIATSILTAFISKILPLSFETIIFYMPAFLSSLLVIPIILIGRSLGNLELGFVAAILASVTWSYYNRTMVGYYDTDMLNIVFPTFLLWSLIWAIRTQEDKYILFTALDIIAYRWWYPQSYSLEFAFSALLGLYIVYQYIKKENFNYNLTLIVFMMFAMMGLDGFIRFLIVVFLFVLLKFKKEIFFRYIIYIFVFALFLFMLTGGLSPIWNQISGFVVRDSLVTTNDELKLVFFSVAQTIREAGKIPFEIFANRISGNPVAFLLSLVGYGWLASKYKVMLLGIPMIGLGFLAYSSGLRFTIYAVPVLAFGIAFLIVELSNKFQNNVYKYGLMILLTIIFLIPNINHIIEYKVPTVFNKKEVEVLQKLKNIASREDYVVGWWDYGYPIRYYADVKTLSDGGKHTGSTNFPVSFALTNPQEQAAKMLRLDVEYTEDDIDFIKLNKVSSFDKIKELFSSDDTKNKRLNKISRMVKDYNYKDVNNFLVSLETNIKLPKKTRDIYVYLPNRMMRIYPTVSLFSNIDLNTGLKGPRPFFYKTTQFKTNGVNIELGNRIKLNKETGKISINNKEYLLNNFVQTSYNKTGKLLKKEQSINNSGYYNAVYMKDYRQFLIVDNNVYNSLYFQLFVLEKYDKNLFEPTILTPLVKIFKLKI